MKKAFLYCALTALALFLLASPVSAETADPLVVTGDAGSAYLFRIGEETYLVGKADRDSLLAQQPEAQVDHVVLICYHTDHVNEAEMLAEALSATVIRPMEAQDALTWQDGALLMEKYAFSVQAPVDGYVTLDCQGEYLPFRASTSTSSVNVRATPTTRGRRVEKLSRGAMVTVVGQVENEAGEVWFSVVLDNGEEGYIRSDLLRVGAAVTATPTPAPSGGGKDERYVGNKSSKVFHRPGCEHLPKGKNAVYFSSRSYAIAKGYRPCEHCDP